MSSQPEEEYFIPGVYRPKPAAPPPAPVATPAPPQQPIIINVMGQPQQQMQNQRQVDVRPWWASIAGFLWIVVLIGLTSGAAWFAWAKLKEVLP